MTLGQRFARKFRFGHCGVAIACIATATVLPPAVGAAQTGGPAAALSQASLTTTAPADYVIGPEDTIKVSVFGVPALTQDQLQVDSSGHVQLPLIGKVVAAGRTAGQLQDDIATRLGEKYLQSPEVSVTVENSQSQKIAVEGDVKQPGVFKLLGSTTLMQALAMAGGPDETANLKKISVLRQVNGRRETVMYDYASINKGLVEDPIITGNEVIVVGNSTGKTIWANVERNVTLLAILASHIS